MANKLIGAVILGVAVFIWVMVRNQEIYALHANAYGFYSLLAVYLAARAKA